MEEGDWNVLVPQLIHELRGKTLRQDDGAGRAEGAHGAGAVQFSQERDLETDPGVMLPDASEEILLAFALQLQKHEIAARIHRQQINQAASSRPQVGIENPKPILDDPGVLQDQALGAFGISGRAPDDADGQPFSAPKSASLSRSTMSWQGENFPGIAVAGRMAVGQE
jgi:hypothetical protein